MKTIMLAVLRGVYLAANFACAAPLPDTEPISLKGEVALWIWRGDMHYSEESWGGTGFEGDVPAHYLVVLNVEGADAEILEGLSDVVRGMNVGHWLMDEKLKPTQVLLLIPSRRIKEMRLGATVEISNYSLSGDERSTAAVFRKFTIDGKKPTPAGPLFPAKPSLKPKQRRK